MEVIPTCWNKQLLVIWYSPRMWRWSQGQAPSIQIRNVFSTYVEVILPIGQNKKPLISILHVCGGDPLWIFQKTTTQQYSPRMWRWSYGIPVLYLWGSVFSTYVEVILHLVLAPLNCDCILHVCGGDPTKSRYYFNPWSILHTCEGDPNWFSGCSYGLRYSPHMLNLLLSWNVQKNSRQIAL